ncbi:hypothetical protein JCM10450v2_005387 [Rhodotorula kratochvilovae]
MPLAAEVITKAVKNVGQGREGLMRLTTAIYSVVLGRTRPQPGGDIPYERLALWQASMERYFSRAYYQQHMRTKGTRLNGLAAELFNHVGAILIAADTARSRSDSSEMQRAEDVIRLHSPEVIRSTLELPAFLQHYIPVPPLPTAAPPAPIVPFYPHAEVHSIEEEQGTGRRALSSVVGLMPMALLGRWHALRGQLDLSHTAVAQWSEAVMRDFSSQYYAKHLNARRIDSKAAARRVFGYFSGLVVFWNDKRMLGTQSEHERVQSFTTLVTPEAIRQTLDLPSFLPHPSPSPEAGPAADEPSDLDPAHAASPAADHRADVASLFPDAHLDPAWAFSLGVEPRLGSRTARVYGTTARRWAAGRAWS